MSPSERRNEWAIASTSAGGGVSETKNSASWREMCRAVAGCRLRMSSTWSTSPTQRVRPDCPVLVIGHHHPDVGFILVDVEMVEPEPGHPFAQLARRIQVAQDLPRRTLPRQLAQCLLVGLLRHLLFAGVAQRVG